VRHVRLEHDDDLMAHTSGDEDDIVVTSNGLDEEGQQSLELSLQIAGWVLVGFVPSDNKHAGCVQDRAELAPRSCGAR
jgi:hypothetical protein